MIQTIDELRSKFLELNTNRSGDRRSPHKPLLLLYAIGQLFRGKSSLDYENVKESLLPLLNSYAPPVSRSHQPELPYWHLANDGIWEVDGGDELPRQKGGFPIIAELRKTSGRLTSDVADLMLGNKRRAPELIQTILDEHFPQSLHEDILAATGLDSILASCVGEDSPAYAGRKRDPRFREKVLRAYEHRCAVTGFRAALGGSFFGCEAAHVQWHAYAGPDSVTNGIALEPTLHKLFDAGAWTLTDDHRILVSADFTGTDSAVERLRQKHGKPLRDPIPGDNPVSPEYIQWHRESNKGGVFREPALPL